VPTPNTFDSLRSELSDLGLDAGMTVMVHSSLGKVGWTVGGPVTVIRALLDAIGTTGTLVMPAETPQVSDPSTWRDARVKAEWHDTIREHLPVFDLLTTPTTMGAIPEAFRTFPGTLRSGAVKTGRVGAAPALFFSTRELVDFAAGYFRRVLR
jgi:aminoglycoside 3-N-acetyltransferase